MKMIIKYELFKEFVIFVEFPGFVSQLLSDIVGSGKDAF